MKKYLLLLIVALGLTIAHAQVVPKIKPESNAELKSSADKIDTMPPVVRRILKMNDSVFVYDRESLQMRVSAKDWPNTPLAKKIAGEGNLNESSPAVNAKSKGNAASEQSMGLPEFTIAVKRNDSIYVYSNGKLLMKTADTSKTLNRNTRVIINNVPIPELQQHQ
jgi:hypothetical protein